MRKKSYSEEQIIRNLRQVGRRSRVCAGSRAFRKARSTAGRPSTGGWVSARRAGSRTRWRS